MRLNYHLRPDPVVGAGAGDGGRGISCPFFGHGAALSVPHPQPPQPAGAGSRPGLACRRRSWMPRPCMRRRNSWWASTISPPSAPPNARPSRRSRRWTGWMSAARGEEIHIEASARSFLHHQIRSFAGTLKLVGEGKWTAARCRRRRWRRSDRAACGPVSPPEGLCISGRRRDDLILRPLDANLKIHQRHAPGSIGSPRKISPRWAKRPGASVARSVAAAASPSCSRIFLSQDLSPPPPPSFRRCRPTPHPAPRPWRWSAFSTGKWVQPSTSPRGLGTVASRGSR